MLLQALLSSTCRLQARGRCLLVVREESRRRVGQRLPRRRQVTWQARLPCRLLLEPGLLWQF